MVQRTRKILSRSKSVSQQSKVNLRHLFAIGALCCVIFANSVYGNFVWDDEVQVVKNWEIRSFTNLPSAFTSAFWSFLGTQAESQTNFYRPVQTVTYMVAYSIGGLSPVAYHVLNIAYHVVASIFVYLIALELMSVPAAAFAVAAIFAVHPVHTEAVAWIAGVPDVACGGFYFGAVWFFLLYLRMRRKLWVSIACVMFFAALMAKEMAVTLPFFLLLVLNYRERSNNTLKKNLSLISPFFGVFALYLVLRFFSLGLLARAHIDAQAGWLDWMSLGIRVLAEYLRYSLLPYPLNAFHLIPLKLQYRIVSTSLSVIVLVALGGLLWHFRRRVPEAIFWSSSFVLMLVPVFYFKGMSNVLLAERYLYIPSFAIIVLVVSVASRLKISTFNLILGITCLVFGLASAYRNQTWRTSEGLYTETLKVQPEVVHMRINLADIYMKRKDDTAAADLLESAERYAESDRYLRFPYELYRAEVGLGAIAARAEKYAEARQHFQKAIEINPIGDWGYLYLGGIFMQADHDYTSAILNFRKAIELGPLNEVARDYMGIAMLNQKRYREAVQYFNQALNINPTYEDARNHLAIATRALTP